jgi:hypothetical protein
MYDEETVLGIQTPCLDKLQLRASAHRYERGKTAPQDIDGTTSEPGTHQQTEADAP